MLCNASTSFYVLTNGEYARSCCLAYRTIACKLETPVQSYNVKLKITWYQDFSFIGSSCQSHLSVVVQKHHSSTRNISSERLGTIKRVCTLRRRFRYLRCLRVARPHVTAQPSGTSAGCTQMHSGTCLSMCASVG